MHTYFMLTQTITLKFTNGRTETAVLHARSHKELSKLVVAKMAATGAYGFGTQSITTQLGR